MSSEIRALINNKVIQLELFGKDLVEVEDDGTRYVLCSNPVLQAEKSQTRESLKSRFEMEIASIKQSWDNRWQQNLSNIENLTMGTKTKNWSLFLPKNK